MIITSACVCVCVFDCVFFKIFLFTKENLQYHYHTTSQFDVYNKIWNSTSLEEVTRWVACRRDRVIVICTFSAFHLGPYRREPTSANVILCVCFVFFFRLKGCGKTLQENSGVFGYSPEPGQEYGDRCEWRITATHGERIVVNITELDILKSDQCGTDYLEIRDGYWHKSPLLGKRRGRVAVPNRTRRSCTRGPRLSAWKPVGPRRGNGIRKFRNLHLKSTIAWKTRRARSRGYPDDGREPCDFIRETQFCH